MSEREREAYLRHAYQLFNDRDVDALLEMMTGDIDCPGRLQKHRSCQRIANVT